MISIGSMSSMTSGSSTPIMYMSPCDEDGRALDIFGGHCQAVHDFFIKLGVLRRDRLPLIEESLQPHKPDDEGIVGCGHPRLVAAIGASGLEALELGLEILLGIVRTE